MSFSILLDAPGEPKRRIQIARLGPISDPRYGDFEITAGNVANWQKNLSALPGHRVLIDFEHRSERKPRDSEAAGWLTGITLDGDKVMGDAEWTPKGESAIREKRYLFLSPAYGPFRNERGDVLDDTLQSIALTNKPVLGSLPMLTLASEERLQAADDAGASRSLDASDPGGQMTGTTTQTLLDLDMRDVFNDDALLNRLVKALAADQDVGFIVALEQLQQAVESSYAETRPGRRTLRNALTWTRSKPGDITDGITLLERRDAAVDAAYQRAVGPMVLEHDSQGFVLLDQGAGAPPTVDIGKALTDPAERERRLARARKLDGSYAADDGRTRFDQEDRQLLEAGVDLVRTLEAQAARHAAERAARQVGRRPDLGPAVEDGCGHPAGRHPAGAPGDSRGGASAWAERSRVPDVDRVPAWGHQHPAAGARAGGRARE